MLKKILVGTIALFLIVTIGVFVWARSILATDAVRTALAAQISNAIGQPVSVGGVDAGIYPRVSVTLRDVGIGPRSQITIQSIDVGTDLRALLSRRIEHASVHLNGAHVELPLPPLGVGSGTETTPAEGSASATVELISIDEVVLTDMEVVSGGRILRGDIEVVPQGRGVLVRRVALVADGASLTATGQITDLAGPAGELSIKAGALDFDQLVAFANDFSGGVGAAQNPSESAPTAGSPVATSTARPMNMLVTIDAERASIGGMTIDKVTARATAKGDAVSVEPLAFGLFDGRYDGALHVTLGSDTPTFQWTATVSNIDVAAATAFAGSPNTISGRLAARVNLSGKGADAATAMTTVSGTVRLDVTNGIIRNLGLVRGVGAATSLSLEGLRRAAVGVRDTDEPFSRLGATFVLGDGMASTDDLEFDADDLSLSASGTAPLDASAINFKGRLLLSEALSQEVHHTLLRMSQENGRVVLPATITGSASEPVVRIDTRDITKRALRNTATEHAPNLVRKGLGGLLRK